MNNKEVEDVFPIHEEYLAAVKGRWPRRWQQILAASVSVQGRSSPRRPASRSTEGVVEKWDELDIDGDIAARDCRQSFKRGGRTLAVATIRRDIESLEAEATMEQDAAVRGSFQDADPATRDG